MNNYNLNKDLLYPTPIVFSTTWSHYILKNVKGKITDKEYWDFYYTAKKLDEEIYIYQKKILISQIWNILWLYRLIKIVKTFLHTLIKKIKKWKTSNI